MPEFGAALAPGDDFVAMEEARGFADEFVFAGEVVIGDFAVVEDSLNFLGIGVHAEGKSGQRSAGGMAGSFLEREISGTKGGARIAGDGLDVDVVKAAAQFEGAHEQNIQEQAAGEAKRTRGSALAKIAGELQDNFFDIILGAASNVGTPRRGAGKTARGKTEFTIKLRRENAAMVRAGQIVAAVESESAVGLPHKQFAEHGKKFRLAIFAEPLNLVLIAKWTEPNKFRDARVEPTERIRKFNGEQGL